jgi:hypothetical protein
VLLSIVILVTEKDLGQLAAAARNAITKIVPKKSVSISALTFCKLKT